MTVIGTNFISGITTTTFSSTDVVSRDHLNTVRPIHEGNSGKFLLTTDGTTITWEYLTVSQNTIYDNHDNFVGVQTFSVPSHAKLLFFEAVGAGSGGDAGQSSAYFGHRWIARTSSVPVNANQLYYQSNPDIYIYAGGQGNLAISTDSINWVLRTTGCPNTSGFSNAKILGGVYIASGTNGIFCTSTDSIAWTVRTVGTVNIIEDTFYRSSQFFRGGTSGQYAFSTNLVVWTLRTSGGSGNILTFLTQLNGDILLGDGDGRMRTSTDTIHWTLRTSPIGTSINKLYLDEYNLPKLYLAGGNTGRLASSTNAVQWFLRTTGLTVAGDILDLSAGDGIYVIVNTLGQIATSTNAIHWSLRTALSGTSNIRSVTYAPSPSQVFLYSDNSSLLGASYFNVGGSGGASGQYCSWYVPTSVINSQITITPGRGGIGATTDGGLGGPGAGTTISWIGPTGGTYRLVASGSSTTSPASRQQVSESSFFATSAGLRGGILGGSGQSQSTKFQATGGGSGGHYLPYSNLASMYGGDGGTFYYQTIFAGEDQSSIYAQGGGIGRISQNNLYTLETLNGSALDSQGLEFYNYLQSFPIGVGGGGGASFAEGIYHWYLRTSGVSSVSIDAIGYGHLGFSGSYPVFVAAANTGNVIISTDAISWEQQSTGLSSTILDFTYNQIFDPVPQYNFLAVGADQYLTGMLLAGDGNTWTLRTTAGGSLHPYIYGITNNLNSSNGSLNNIVLVGGSTFVPFINSSTNGIVWTLRTSSATDYLTSITWNYEQGLYVAGGRNGTLITSTDSIQWTLRTLGSSLLSIKKIVNGGDRYLALAQNIIFSSTDAIFWFVRTKRGGNANDCAYGDGNYVLACNGGDLVSSTDTIHWFLRTSKLDSLETISSIKSSFGYTHDTNLTCPGSSFVVGSSQGKISSTSVYYYIPWLSIEANRGAGNGNVGFRGGGGGGGAIGPDNTVGMGGSGGHGYVRYRWW